MDGVRARHIAGMKISRICASRRSDVTLYNAISQSFSLNGASFDFSLYIEWIAILSGANDFLKEIFFLWWKEVAQLIDQDKECIFSFSE